VLDLQYRSVALDSGRIAYLDEGAGPTVLLLHGGPVTSLGFLRVVRELRARYRVVAPDLPGFGHSTVGPRFRADLAGYAAFVEDFTVALDLRDACVYVNDASGCFGLSALASPAVAPRVAGLIIASTVPVPLTGRAWPVKLMLKYVVSSRLLRYLNRRLNLLPWLVATVAPWLNPFARPERRALTAQFDTFEKRDRIIDLFAAMGRDDAFMRATAERVRGALADKPTLLLYGQFDPVRFAGGVARFRKLLPRSSARIIRFEEHFPILASGARVARQIDDWIRAEVAS
jgi:haloalkane dehalogenase